MDTPNSGPDRRAFLRTSTTVAGIALLAPSLSGLIGCAAPATRGGRQARRAGQGEGGYGPLRPAGPELALPAGFSYAVISTAGQPMSDGRPTPNTFDGMAAFPRPDGMVRLIRNHENRDNPLTAKPFGNPFKAYDPKAGGGCTTLDVRLAEDGSATLVRDFVSLNGTIINCAGGPTPWGSWLSCEETTDGPAQGWTKQHGYIFEVPVSAESEVDPVPLKEMGRLVHEAVAVDPRSGIVYETEDRYMAGFYRFIPNQPGFLQAGGKLEMLAVDGRRQVDLSSGQRVGESLSVTWVPIENPDRNAVWDSAGVFEQGYSIGGARFSRLEGCWYGDESVYFHATNGGDAKLGQIWQYRPTASDGGELTLIFESPSADVLAGPDNVTVSPRGGIVICEDNGDANFIRGLTPDGRIFDFAKNILNKDEFAGACFSPNGKTLFLNIMGSTVSSGTSMGRTVAIWGPWEDGAL